MQFRIEFTAFICAFLLEFDSVHTGSKATGRTANGVRRKTRTGTPGFWHYNMGNKQPHRAGPLWLFVGGYATMRRDFYKNQQLKGR